MKYLSKGIVLVSVSVDGAARGLSNPDFEGCIRGEGDESGEPQRGPLPPRNKLTQMQAPQTKPKYDKALEPKYEIHEKNLKYKPRQFDTGFHSEEALNGKRKKIRTFHSRIFANEVDFHFSYPTRRGR